MDATDTPLQAMIERIREAAPLGLPLRIRGGGTKDFYGEALSGELLDTRALTGITAYEPSELYATVRAGTPLAELEAVLAQHGQCLPFEPPRFRAGSPLQPSGFHPELPIRSPRDLLPLPPGEGWGEAAPAVASPTTIGGMIAAGLSGPSRASVGCVRDYLLGARLVNGRAESLTFGGQVMKNVAGYDISRVLAGSLGTLGLIVEVSLKVLPVVPAEATLRFEMDQLTALKRLNEWGGQPLPLNASCWLESSGTEVLYLRLRGAVAAVQAACARMGGEAVAWDWDAMRDQTHSFFAPVHGHCLWRLSVAPAAPSLPLAHGTVIEWHGGLRWLHAPASQAGAIRAAARDAGGHATLFRGDPGAIGGLQTERVFTPLTPALDRIQRELKKQFDPAGIFNRGRLQREY